MVKKEYRDMFDAHVEHVGLHLMMMHLHNKYATYKIEGMYKRDRLYQQTIIDCFYDWVGEIFTHCPKECIENYGHEYKSRYASEYEVTQQWEEYFLEDTILHKGFGKELLESWWSGWDERKKSVDEHKKHFMKKYSEQPDMQLKMLVEIYMNGFPPDFKILDDHFIFNGKVGISPKENAWAEYIFGDTKWRGINISHN